MDQTWFNTTQAAVYTGRHADTIREAAIDGELRSAQPGGRKGHRRYHRAWLDAWVLGVPGPDLADLAPSA